MDRFINGSGLTACWDGIRFITEGAMVGGGTNLSIKDLARRMLVCMGGVRFRPFPSFMSFCPFRPSLAQPPIRSQDGGMTATELEKAVHAVPFRPFELVTGDGQKFPVPTRDHFSMSPSKRLATVWWDDDSHSVLDVFLIMHVDYFADGMRRRKTGKR